MFFRRRSSTSDVARDIAEIPAAFDAALASFGRDLGRQVSSRTAGHRAGRSPARLPPPPQARRAVPHRSALPPAQRRRQALTVLQRRWRMRGHDTRPPFAEMVETRAEGFAARLRGALLALRAALGALRDRFRRRPRFRLGTVSHRSTPHRDDGSDRALTALVIATTAALSYGFTTTPSRVIEWAVPPPSVPISVPLLNERVNTIAEAIAIAEGYYADGFHDGHTLPYYLNNPGALKMPALGARDLPTWKDTGLIWFPSAEMGWAALRHQVRLMLTGESGIYDPSDTLLHVASKYADGDLSWGLNVAAHLGVPPASTLAELAQ